MPNFIQQLLNNNREKQELKVAIENLVEDSRLTFRFVLYSLIASLLAALGIIMNNTPVVIGSMLVSPFLVPILGLAVGIGAGSLRMIRHSLVTLVTGFILGLLAPLTLSLYLQPTLGESVFSSISNPAMYSVVAILSGILAAYSWFHSTRNPVIPGVAIAVALMPPLAMAGILMPLGEKAYLMETLQLLLVNTLGILLGAFLTFLLIRFVHNLPDENVDKEVEKGVEKNDN